MTDPFARPEGLAAFRPGTWPAPSDIEAACGCQVREGEAIGRDMGEILCENHLEETWEERNLWDSHPW